MLWDNRRLATAFGLPVDDGLTEEERKRLQRQAMMQSGAAMLAGSGWSQTPVTLGQGMAAGMMAGQDAYAQGYGQLQQQRQAMLERQKMLEKQQAIAAYRAQLAPEQQRIYDLMGPEAYAKEQMLQRNRKELEKEKAAGKDNRTTLQKEAEAMFPNDPARQHGYIQNAREKSGTRVDVSLGGANTPLGKKGQELSATNYFDMQNQAGAAMQGLQSIEALESVFQNLETGKISEAQGRLGQWLGTEGGADFQASEAIVQDRVFEIINALKGPATEKDAERAQAQVPNMGFDPRARKVVFDYIRRKAASRVKNYQAATKYLEENGSLIGFLPPQSTEFNVGSASRPALRPAMETPAPEDIEAEMRRRGLIR